MASKVKELAKTRTECAEKETRIASMKIEIQSLNKAVEEVKNKAQTSEEEVSLLLSVFSYSELFFSLLFSCWQP